LVRANFMPIEPFQRLKYFEEVNRSRSVKFTDTAIDAALDRLHRISMT
jgi:hypothetical protein